MDNLFNLQELWHPLQKTRKKKANTPTVMTHCHLTVEAQRGSEDCGFGGLGRERRRLGGELLGATTELSYN